MASAHRCPTLFSPSPTPPPNRPPPGARGAHQRKPPPALLSGAGEEKLKRLFEGLCADKHNLERLTEALGASLSTKQVARELRRLGLKFGSLPAWLAPRLAELWVAARGKGGKGEDLEEVARQLPGGWSAKQVRKLLKDHGLVGGGAAGRRRRGPGAGRGGGSDGDDGGWESDLEGADPLLEAERSVVEDLYCRHLAHNDYLEKPSWVEEIQWCPQG
ncbi:hypothetical protein MNEG_16400 [Monoraphidium neglectum]|uniref:Uncharacterized protein n=1 Tax=Monoraphidium neglectum TaxID=145388 RepID=A0A0D2LHR0_9CHLO|nr:hypothetical protein MNEG_16400 [Monoraphidium neglectum]KIY91564.1 hypothetical protein MNEG_16400 [Monoraphidium neglectum]|eukprot:XP_013890584.1 hypothetical protein MNEG_16400 [Monoraphidium neglectum]